MGCIPSVPDKSGLHYAIRADKTGEKPRRSLPSERTKLPIYKGGRAVPHRSDKASPFPKKGAPGGNKSGNKNKKKRRGSAARRPASEYGSHTPSEEDIEEIFDDDDRAPMPPPPPPPPPV